MRKGKRGRERAGREMKRERERERGRERGRKGGGRKKKERKKKKRKFSQCEQVCWQTIECRMGTCLRSLYLVSVVMCGEASTHTVFTRIQSHSNIILPALFVAKNQ